MVIQQLFEEYFKHHTGCGNGGGRSSNQIFQVGPGDIALKRFFMGFFFLLLIAFWLNLQDSGLTVISNINIRVSRRDDTGCNRISRKRRSSGTLFY